MSIRKRFLISLLCISAIPFIVAAYFMHNYSYNLLKEDKLNEFEIDNAQIADKLEIFLENYRRIVRFVVSTPPIQGILRSEASGVDPIDQSTYDQWKNRLETIFISEIESNPEIFQLRYLDTDGNELVRVNNIKGSTEVISDNKLQNKADSNYFKKGILLKENEVGMSNMELNRESGVIQEPYILTVRVFSPVYGEKSQKIEGLIVLNLFVEKLFALIEEYHPDSKHITLIDESGNYLFQPGEEHFKFFIDEKKYYMINDVGLMQFLLNRDAKRFEDKDNERYLAKTVIAYDGSVSEEYWILVQELEEVELLSQLSNLKNILMLLSFVILFIAVIAAFRLSSLLTNPISNLADLAAEIEKGNKVIDVDPKLASRNDEIGRLAKTFVDMTKKLVESNRNLELAIDEKTNDLIRTQEKFNLAVDGSNDGLWEWEVGTNDVWYASRFKELLGYKDKEFADKLDEFKAHLHPDDIEATLESIDQHVNHNKPYDVEYRLRKKSGQYNWFRARGKSLRDEQGKAIRMAGSIQDIEEKKQVELRIDKVLNTQKDKTKELEDLYDATLNIMEDLQMERQKAEQLSDEAQAAAKAKSDFLANMSHEIRTPMNAVLGFSDLLNRTELNDKQRNYLETILSSGQLLLGLINDILDFSKLEAGRLSLEEVDFDLEKLSKDVFKMIRSRLEGKSINTYIDIEKDVFPFLVGDPTRLRQILINLLGNAVKFTEKGEIGLSIKKVKDDENMATLEFRVKDTGIGIPKDKLSSVFELFTQADTSTTRKFGGTGLGLAICKSLIEAMNGEIWIESEIGEGSQFCFTATLGKSSKDKLKKRPQDESGELAGKRVIIVDDNKMTLRILEKYCEDCGMAVAGLYETAQGALRGMEEYIEKDENVDVVISDIMMPNMDGHEFIKKVRAHEKLGKIKAVAISDDFSSDIFDKTVESGFDVFIPKPIIKEDLIEQLNELFAESNKKATKKVSIAENQKDESAAKRKILVVEDSEPNQQLMQAYFDIIPGCEVDYAGNGQEAVDILKEKTDYYDLCFMDMQMPVMGGLEATEIIRKEIAKELPIIALTANVMKEDQEKCFKVGMNDYLSKPINMVKLQETVDKYAKKS